MITVAGTWETNRQVTNAVTDMLELGYGEERLESLSDRLSRLGKADVGKLAQETIRPNGVFCIVVGDREAIEPDRQEPRLGPVFEIDEVVTCKGVSRRRREHPKVSVS